jgi:uncharacterized iron-regulated membrane protein
VLYPPAMTMIWVLVALVVLLGVALGTIAWRDRNRTSSAEDTEANRAATAAARLGAANGYAAQGPGETARKMDDMSGGH